MKTIDPDKMLTRLFEPGRRYRETEVNSILNRFHQDQCTLRRYLADLGYLKRQGGWYWRAERPETQVSSVDEAKS